MSDPATDAREQQRKLDDQIRATAAKAKTEKTASPKPTPPSAMAKDEATRAQRDQENVLRKSVGIQDADGNQLHGRARTDAARNLRDEMKAAASTQAKAPETKPTEARIGALRVTINQPHRAQCRGNELALTIKATPAAVGDAATFGDPIRHPFLVTKRPNPTTPGSFDRIVAFDSQLLTSIAKLTQATVSGLADDFEPTPTDSGWINLDAEDRIWLEVGFTPSGAVAVPSSWDIKSYGNGDDWDAFAAVGGQSLVEWSGDGSGGDPFIQTIARCVIARAPGDANGVPQIVQVVHSDLWLIDANIDGKVVKILVESGGV